MAMNKVDINDILTNDPEIYNQKFFVLSYILPSDKNEIKHPLIKMRGAFKTYEDAEKRVDVLKRSDKYFNIYIATVGTWGSLLPEEQLLQSDEVDTVYREPELNEIFQKYKENREKAQEEHEKRRELMKRRAQEESSRTFQEYITFCDEVCKNYVVPQTSSIEDFDEYKDNIENLEGYLNFFNVLRSCESSYYLSYRDGESTKEDLSTEIQDKIDTFLKKTDA
jgi:hypothetical protein